MLTQANAGVAPEPQSGKAQGELLKDAFDDKNDKLAIGNFVTLLSSTKDFLTCEPSASEVLDGVDKSVLR